MPQGIKEPNLDKPVAAKRKSRFIGELKIEDLWYRSALSFLFKSIDFLKYSIWLWHKYCANML